MFSFCTSNKEINEYKGHILAKSSMHNIGFTEYDRFWSYSRNIPLFNIVLKIQILKKGEYLCIFFESPISKKEYDDVILDSLDSFTLECLEKLSLYGVVRNFD